MRQCKFTMDLHCVVEHMYNEHKKLTVLRTVWVLCLPEQTETNCKITLTFESLISIVIKLVFTSIIWTKQICDADFLLDRLQMSFSWTKTERDLYMLYIWRPMTFTWLCSCYYYVNLNNSNGGLPRAGRNRRDLESLTLGSRPLTCRRHISLCWSFSRLFSFHHIQNLN